jgi:hypothetical protein
MNFKHDGGISDLNHQAHFRRRVDVASRLIQTLGIIFVGYDEKLAGSITLQFDGKPLSTPLRAPTCHGSFGRSKARLAMLR